jgi:hypothetical protein
MENLTPHPDKDPKRLNPERPDDEPGASNDRPRTPDDGFSDQGRKAEETDRQQESTNAVDKEIPELIPDRNDVENQDPTPFDIDESTG